MVTTNPTMDDQQTADCLVDAKPLPLVNMSPPQAPVNRPVQTTAARGNSSNSIVYEEFVTDDYCVDRESVRRKFGWATLGHFHDVPFIYRNGDKYCAVRMIDKYVFDKYLISISDNIYFGCTNILGYYVTIPESLLLNEINEFHCENFYGAVPFKQGDVLVRFDDANAFYEFLLVCYDKFFNVPYHLPMCGFVTMNERSLLPYVIMKNKKYVPLFYLDGIEGIKFKVETAKGWHLSYLKFCFKVHGIRDEYCRNDECSVVCLEEIKRYLEPFEEFVEAWPMISPTNKALFQPKKVSKHMVKTWHQHPITVLPVSTVKYSKVLANRGGVPTTENVTTKTNSSGFYRTISNS